MSTTLPNDLVARCAELLAWRRTGLLKGDALRTFASQQFYADFHNHLHMAENDTARQAFEVLVALSSAEPVPYVLGNRYQTQAGEWVRFVAIHNEGTDYETMEDENGVNRYTRRDFGRVTATPFDYSHPKNVPPTYAHPALPAPVPAPAQAPATLADALEQLLALELPAGDVTKLLGCLAQLAPAGAMLTVPKALLESIPLRLLERHGFNQTSVRIQRILGEAEGETPLMSEKRIGNCKNGFPFGPRCEVRELYRTPCEFEPELVHRGVVCDTCGMTGSLTASVEELAAAEQGGVDEQGY